MDGCLVVLAPGCVCSFTFYNCGTIILDTRFGFGMAFWIGRGGWDGFLDRAWWRNIDFASWRSLAPFGGVVALSDKILNTFV